MRLKELFSRSHEGRAEVLIDISESSVAGAYVYQTSEQPMIIYARRLPIEAREHESLPKAMLRAFSILLDAMISEGAPELARSAGSGRIDSVLAAIGAPWQETRVRTERFESDEPFVFGHRMLADALEKTAPEAPSQVLCDESIVGIVLNGYETRRPYGKRSRRAAVLVLSSLIAEDVAAGVRKAVAAAYHTDRVVLIAGTSLRYQALRAAFAHEHTMLVVDGRGPLLSIGLVRDNLLAAISEMPARPEKWGSEIPAALKKLAAEYPLPRTIFLVMRGGEAAACERAFALPAVRSLWLSTHPPKVVALLPTHLRGLVVQREGTPGDLPLDLAALYGAHRAHLLKEHLV